MSILTGRNRFNEAGLLNSPKQDVSALNESAHLGSLGQHSKQVVDGVKHKLEESFKVLKKTALETRVRAAEEAFHSLVNEMKTIPAFKDAEFDIENPTVKYSTDKYGGNNATIEGMEISITLLKEGYNHDGLFGDVVSEVESHWSGLDIDSMTFYCDEATWNGDGDDDDEHGAAGDTVYYNFHIDVDDELSL